MPERAGAPTIITPGSLPRIAADRAARSAAPYTLVPSRGLLFSPSALVGANVRVVRETASAVTLVYTDPKRQAAPITHTIPRNRLRVTARPPRAGGDGRGGARKEEGP